MHEALKNDGLFIRRNADPGIPDRNTDGHSGLALSIQCRSHNDFAAFGELDAIADEIRQDLSQTDRIAGEFLRERGIEITVQLNPLLASLRG